MKSWTACERFGKAFKTLEKVCLEQVWKSLQNFGKGLVGTGLEKPGRWKGFGKALAWKRLRKVWNSFSVDLKQVCFFDKHLGSTQGVCMTITHSIS